MTQNSDNESGCARAVPGAMEIAIASAPKQSRANRLAEVGVCRLHMEGEHDHKKCGFGAILWAIGRILATFILTIIARLAENLGTWLLDTGMTGRTNR